MAEESKGQRRPRDEDLPLILELVANGISLTKACAQLGLHRPMVTTWLRVDKDRRDQYARAREDGADALIDETTNMTLACAMQATFKDANGQDRKIEPNGMKVHLDAMRWKIGQMAPKTHGETINLNHNFDGRTNEELRQQLEELRAQREAKNAG